MTIRLRLALIYGAAIAITIALVGVVVSWQLATALRTSLDQTLETRATAAMTSLENSGQSGLQEGDLGGPPGVFLAIFDAQGRTIDATAGVPPGLAPAAAGVARFDLTTRGSTYVLHQATADTGIRVVAGSSLGGIQDTLDRLSRSLAVVGGMAVIASFVGGWWLARRALGPVALITTEAAQIGATDLDRRLPVTSRRDELQGLALTLNGMLDRVADALRRQRAFVASASHDLRTPIAALRTELELAEDPRTTEFELRAAVRAAHADAVRLGELATALLDLATVDADGRAVVRAPVGTDVIVESVARRTEALARQREAEVTQAAPRRIVRVDRLRVEQALTNIVINAITYGPPGAEVNLVARVEPADPGGGPEQGSILSVDVLDRGPGIPPEFAGQLFEPFSRGPNAGGHGSGLGLATAAAAIRAHHGSIGFEARSGGGTRFWIRVPV
jgi:two-component system OmpR family sensor kinase